MSYSPLKPLGCCTAHVAAVVGMIVSLSGQRVEASIQVEDELFVDAAETLSLEHLESFLEKPTKAEQELSRQPSAACSSSGSQPKWLVEQFLALHGEHGPQFAHFGQPPGGATGSTSSTSSTSVSGSVSTAMLNSVSTPLLDDSPLERHVAERALRLPDAPENEMLRPPQHGAAS